MKEEEESPQERFAFVSKTFSSNPEHAQRLYDYSSRHWLSYSTPILSYGRSKKGMPISCFLNYINDTAEGLVENLSETNWLSILASCLILKLTTPHASPIGKAVLDGVLMLLTLILVIQML